MQVRWWMIVAPVAIAVAVLLTYIWIFSVATTSPGECSVDVECELSLCDCTCYAFGQIPEKTQGIQCGKNCAAWFNVTGCACQDRACVTLKGSPSS